MADSGRRTSRLSQMTEMPSPSPRPRPKERDEARRRVCAVGPVVLAGGAAVVMSGVALARLVLDGRDDTVGPVLLLGGEELGVHRRPATEIVDRDERLRGR